MKRYLALLAVLMMLMAVGSVPNQADVNKVDTNKAILTNGNFMLTVTLDSPYNHHFQVMLPVFLDKPFKVETTNSGVVNIISGTVSSPLQGKYPLPISVTEKSALGKDSIGSTHTYNLELDKALGFGVVASVTFNQTVKLSKMPE